MCPSSICRRNKLSAREKLYLHRHPTFVEFQSNLYITALYIAVKLSNFCIFVLRIKWLLLLLLLYPVYHGHRTTSQNFQLPYIFCKVDLNIAVTLYITVTVPFPMQFWLYCCRNESFHPQWNTWSTVQTEGTLIANSQHGWLSFVGVRLLTLLYVAACCCAKFGQQLPTFLWSLIANQRSATMFGSVCKALQKFSVPRPRITRGLLEDHSRGVWLIVAGRGSKVGVAGPMSRSRVQSRGRGSNVAAGENDLEFEVTEWKRVIWKKYKGEKIVFMHDTLR